MDTNTVKVPARLTLSVIAACLVSFCGLLTETAVNIAFPAIMADLGVSISTIQWLTTGNLLVVAMITPLSSFLQKRFKLKTLFGFGTLMFLLGSALAFLAPSFPVLLAARCIQGIATGVGVPIAFSIILEQIPPEKSGTFMGFGALVTAAAPALGPTYGGVITSTLGWRNIFAILIPVLALTMLLGMVSIREIRVPQRTPIDLPGILLIMATFFCLVFGFANIGSIAAAPIPELLLFAVGLAALILFVRHCSRAKFPLIQVEIFKNIPFVCHLVSFFLINAIMLGTAFLLPNYLQVVLGVASMAAGFMMLPGAALNAVSGPVSGGILDCSGPQVPILAGSLLMGVGILLMALFGTSLSPTMIVGFYIVSGVGCGFAFGSTMTTGMTRLPMELKSYGNTAFNTLMQFAGAVGTSVMAVCVAFAQNSAGPLSHAAKTALGATHGFVILLVLSVLCIVLQIVGFRSYSRANMR